MYANQLAKRGFVCLTFDPSYHGYSGGEIRMTASTATYVEDFSAGVDFLGTLGYVDREKLRQSAFAAAAAMLLRRHLWTQE